MKLSFFIYIWNKKKWVLLDVDILKSKYNFVDNLDYFNLFIWIWFFESLLIIKLILYLDKNVSIRWVEYYCIFLKILNNNYVVGFINFLV